MKETYNSEDNASSAVNNTSHDKREPRSAANPLVLQDAPEDDDEPPIRPSTHHRPSGHNSEKFPHRNDTEHISFHLHSTASNGGTLFTLEKRPFDRHPSELAQYLHTSLSSGLDDLDAQNRLKCCGKNILKGQEKVTVWAVLWRQVSNAMTVILLGALAIAFATKDFAEGGVIAGTITHSFSFVLFCICALFLFLFFRWGY